ncbi:MAG: metal ABC transporter ATP-binding protein, partial [Brockia lithotrophica]|nr:metal ABC transporter ATP-binding protein [Brockia lithotrophica]
MSRSELRTAPASAGKAEPVLELRGITFAYDRLPVLEDVSLTLHRGELLGLVGPNGSGKSTLVRIALGLLRPDAGSVVWFGTPLEKFRAWSRVGYVSQKAASFNLGFPASVAEVVTMGLTGKLGLFRFPGRREREKVREALETVGMSAFADRPVGRLSGGQQQRVFIARALVSDPEVLILDEPTVGVDARSEAEFYALLEKLNGERKLSILLVSHDLGAVSERMHTVVVLNRRVFFAGSAADFRARWESVLREAYGELVVPVAHLDASRGLVRLSPL